MGRGGAETTRPDPLTYTRNHHPLYQTHEASLSFTPQDETVLPTQTCVPRHQAGPTYPPPLFFCLAEEAWRVIYGPVAMAVVVRVSDSATAARPGSDRVSVCG